MKRLAMYLRLSVEDELKAEESNSISSQRNLIQEYICQDPELSSYDKEEFCDDGYTGTDMKRPGMQRLLQKIKRGKIQCIVVKDMSRFSRDYIEMGTYIDRIFPEKNIRFISICDHYDSLEMEGKTMELDLAFQMLLYDLYSKDISLKVKRVIEEKASRGKYVFGQVPFGYQKEGKNRVVIQPEEAKLVQYIFFLAEQKLSTTQIARQLYEQKIPTITQMRKPYQKENKEQIRTWSAACIRRILNNRFYLGEMEYKGKVFKRHHPSLISEKTYENAAFDGSKRGKRKGKIRHPLIGKIYCGGCGYAMVYRQKKGEFSSGRFECPRHAILQIPKCCTYLNGQAAEGAVLEVLKKEGKLELERLSKTAAEVFLKKVVVYKGGCMEIQFAFLQLFH